MAYHDTTDPHTASDDRRLACPLCGQPVLRVQRRPIDRLASLFSPVQRFRCRNHDCQWMGNIKVKRSSSLDTGSGSKV